MAAQRSVAFAVRTRIPRPAPETAEAFRTLSPTTLCEVLMRETVMDRGIRPLWPGMPRVAGPALTVRCPAGDNLMVHAAIHRAEPRDILVIQGGVCGLCPGRRERLRVAAAPGGRRLRGRGGDPRCR